MDSCFREFVPPATLSECAEAIWVRSPPGAPGAALTILPDGCMDLLYRYAEDRDGRIGLGELLIAGPDRTARSFAPPVGHSFIGLRFRPAEARRILDVDPGDLRDAGVVSASISMHLAALERRLASSPNRRALLRTLTSEIASIASANAVQRPPRRVRQAIAQLRGPQPRIDLIASHLGVAPRTLHREVVTWTGLAPKRLARIFRLQSALREIRAGDVQLASVAVATGYADQAHMTREFRDLAAAPPSRFR